MTNNETLALYVVRVGSRLYGFDTEESDYDFKGFCLSTIPQLLGLERFEQQEYTNGRPDGPTKEEGVLHSISQYLHLGVMKCNPTVLEFAFVRPEFYIHTTELGLEVAKFVRENSITKKLFAPYSAYHRAQVRKLQSMERTGKRAEMVAAHGYDLKFAVHSYRLGRQATIAMSTGQIIPTLEGEDLRIAKEMRAGKYSKEEALAILESVDRQMYDAYKASTLPESPDYHKVENFLIDIHTKYIRGEYDIKPWKATGPNWV
jgi:predicted nucleotidyltransferase